MTNKTYLICSRTIETAPFITTLQLFFPPPLKLWYFSVTFSFFERSNFHFGIVQKNSKNICGILLELYYWIGIVLMYPTKYRDVHEIQNIEPSRRNNSAIVCSCFDKGCLTQA